MLLDGVKPYLKDLASGSHVPGGGAATAITVAQGLALLSMVCNLTIGKKKFLNVENEIKDILKHLSDLIDKALLEGQKDMEAFDAVMNAYRLSSDSESEKIMKKKTLIQTTKEAVIPPYKLLRLSRDALLVARRLEKIGNPSVLSDVLVGKHLLKAGCYSSIENMEVNLRSLPPNDPFTKDMRLKIKNTS